MEIDITLKNYRCFPDSNPARISLRRGFTAFVGVNNSGKSSLLRFFYEFRSLFALVTSPGNVCNALRGKVQAFSPSPSILDVGEVFSNTNGRDLEIEIRFLAADYLSKQRPVPTPDRVVLTIPRSTNNWKCDLYLGDGSVGHNVDFGLKGSTLVLRNEQIADLDHLSDVFTSLRRTLYIGASRNAINIGSNENYFDIQVGQGFIRTWRGYKTGNIKKHNEAAIRLTKEIGHIFGIDDLQIDSSQDEQTLQVFVNGKSYKLHEVGSGLTQFILVLATAATRESSYIFIDEPELNLHPSLQLDFLTTLASYADEGIVFGTQSIGLARASAERIYLLRRITEGESKVTALESTPRLSEFLGELSFSGYRELGFNNVLLVEGVKDVKTIQQFLRMLKKDHQIVLLPLGGTQLINQQTQPQLEELKRISDNIFALIDSERAAKDAPLSREREGFVRICGQAKVRCHVLDRRAIENYLSDRAIKTVKSEKYHSLKPYERLEEVRPAWSKEENWRIARSMTIEELQGTDLWEFLDSI